MKKAQIEMIGLLLIVILLVLGGLFYLRFFILRPEPIAQESIIRTTQATNTLYGLTKINICERTTLRYAFASCADRSNDILCNELPSCALLTQRLPEILNSSLVRPLALDYTLTARTENNAFFTLSGGCTTGIAPSYTFQEEGKNYELQLRLCKN